MTHVEQPRDLKPGESSTDHQPMKAGHGGHWVVCGIAGAVLVALVIVGWLPNPFALGFGLALLVCPLTMGAVMWILMRTTAAGSQRGSR